MTDVRILTAVTGTPWEAALVAGLERAACGVSVVRRCVDVAELLAAAAAGHARAALLSADLRRLDREALARLSAARVAAIGIIGPGDEDAERHLRQLGISHIVTADTPATDVAAAVRRAVSEQPPHPYDHAFADLAVAGMRADPVPDQNGEVAQLAHRPDDGAPRGEALRAKAADGWRSFRMGLQ